MVRRIDTLITDCRLATMVADAPDGYGAIDDGAVAIEHGRIVWSGARTEMPSFEPTTTHRLAGRWVTPGLVDCHTHLVFGGDRAAEFEMRLQGADYASIARRGGGIASTVDATRGLGKAALMDVSRPRLNALRAGGATTVEIKSGYGLDVESEMTMLRAARGLGREAGIRVVTTFLGLHALPGRYADRADAYVDEVINVILPAVAAEGLADAVDGYVEPIAFSTQQARRFFDAASDYGLPARIHADQLSNSGGTALAASIGALSADHIEYADNAAIEAMAAAGVVAVLLPGAFLMLREAQKPPIELLRRNRVAMAVATDCNPGTSPLASPLLAMALACTLFRLTPAEALLGMTRNAACALELGDEIGAIAHGMAADLAVWNIGSLAELCYWMGVPLLDRTYVAGEVHQAVGTAKLAESSNLLPG